MSQTHSIRPPAPDVDGRDWLLGAGYVGVFLLLDWVSYIRPLQGLNITPWNPQPALAIALLLWRPRWAWLVWLGLVTAELVVRGVPRDAFVTVAVTLALTLVYKGAARALVSHMDVSRLLERRRDLLWLLAICLGAALVGAVSYVAVHAAADGWNLREMQEAVARYWIGDAAGLVVALPIVLVLSDARHRASVMQALRTRTWWFVSAAIVLLLWAVFWRGDPGGVRFFYLLLLPVLWAAARLGVAGAALASAVTQIGLIVALQSVPNPDLTVFEMQALMSVLTLAALLLGVAVDEQARVADELRRSLRLAAAGQMTAALAHELSQPLTALSNYAQACRMLVAGEQTLSPERRRQLADVTRRMTDDAQRAGAVIKRLRDFFRQGTTRLQRIDPAVLAGEASTAQKRRADSTGVELKVWLEPALPEILVDPVQIAVVLRNLLANAIDAAAAQAAPGRVELRVSRVTDALQIDVLDNGPGVDTSRLHQLFEPGLSDKPGGMGVGLSICRAIVEAHGGRLWAVAGPSGRFAFTLPVGQDDPDVHTNHAS